MTKIIEISGAGQDMPAPGDKKLFTFLSHDIGEISEGQLDLLIARDNMVSKRNIVAKQIGIGAVKTQKFQNTIDVLDDALHATTLPNAEAHMVAIEEDILSGLYSQENSFAGIGSIEEIGRIRKARANTRRANRAKRVQAESISGIGKAKAAKKAATKTGAFIKKAAAKTLPALKKVVAPTKAAAANVKAKAPIKNAAAKVKQAAGKAGQAIKKGGAVVLKVATAPTRLLVKGILELTLPKAAPFFLYLFINDPKIIAKLPAKVKRKRDTALRVKNFIVNVIGMKDAHFMGIVRNGIMKQMGASPETILSRSITSLSGIGVLPEMIAQLVVQIIGKLIDGFKKNREGTPTDAEIKDAVPDPAADFGEVSAEGRQQASADIKKQNDLPEPTEERNESSAAQSPAPERAGNQFNSAPSSRNESPAPSGGSSESAAPASNASSTAADTNANGEILKDAGSSSNEFATGGRKGWNTFG